MAVVFGLSIWSNPGLDLRGYPVDAVEYLADRGWLSDGKLAHDDVTGGYLILRDGADAQVFYDDRFDMYPVSFSRDVLTLRDGGRDAAEILEKRGIETVLWPADRSLSSILEASPGWRQVFGSDGWLVFRRV